jgi:hypothetical protein
MNKIDLIIDALYKTKLLMDAHGQYPHTLREVDEALAAARELRELKPVAWIKRPEKVGYKSIKLTFDPPEDNVSTPLYALEEVTK